MSRTRGTSSLWVDDDVCERDGKARARLLDDPSLEPVRPARRVGGKDQFVGPERADGVCDRLDRVAVADLTGGVEAGGTHRSEARVEPCLRGRSRAVLIGGPVPKRRIQSRTDHEDTRLGAARTLANLAEELCSSDRLVRDDEDPVLAGRTRRGRLLHRRLVLTAAQNPPEDAGSEEIG